MTCSSQHSNFPASNVRDKHLTRSWRSRYGAGSGWGLFVITAGVNDKIDFEETVATPLVATLTPGSYTADTLATEIKTRLEVAGASTYTISYSDATNKFIMVSDGLGGGGIFTLLWNSGANKATSVAGTIGFSDVADDSAALTYTADNVRIHSEEWLKLDAGAAIDVLAIAFRNHNFSQTATVKFQAHTADAWGAPDVDTTLSLASGLTIYFPPSLITKRWFRLYATDVDNSDGYNEIGRMSLGEYFSPASNPKRDYAVLERDPSELLFSDNGQVYSNQRTKFKTFSYVFDFINATDLASFRAMYDSVGLAKDFFFTEDRNRANATSHYVRFQSDLEVVHIIREEMYRVYVHFEEMR